VVLFGGVLSSNLSIVSPGQRPRTFVAHTAGGGREVFDLGDVVTLSVRDCDPRAVVVGLARNGVSVTVTIGMPSNVEAVAVLDAIRADLERLRA
jgi:hypothetical protein